MEKKLTPLMEAIKEVKDKRYRLVIGSDEFSEGCEYALKSVLMTLNSLLPEEEKDMIEFRKSALISAGMNENLAQAEASEMFRQTFKTNDDQIDFELNFCERCIQMTNHLNGECQKHKTNNDE